MYDLGYFRNNLGTIAARLADRGFTVDMEAFRELDSQRRAALTESEKLKAQRNAESQEIGKLKKAGGDTADKQQRVREMGELITKLDGEATRSGREVHAADGGHPEHAARIGAGGEERGRQRRGAPLGHAAGIFVHSQGALGPGAGTGHPGFRPGGEDHRSAVCGLHGAWERSWSAR